MGKVRIPGRHVTTNGSENSANHAAPQVRSITAVAISIFTCGAAWLALFSLPFVVTCRPGILTLPIGKWLVYCKNEHYNYCIYYYMFPQSKCDDTVLKFQGKTFERNLKNMMKESQDMLTLPRFNHSEKDVPQNLSISLFQCMKEDLEASLAQARGKRVDFFGSTTFYIILGLTVGGIGLIALAAMLIPVFLNIRRERHKKWLEQTWEERVRQAANDIRAEEGIKGCKEKTRPGRKAVRGSAEGSREVCGSKEGVASKELLPAEKASKDDIMKDDQLFPAAIGPNEGRPSAEAAGAVGGGNGFGGQNAGFGGQGGGFGGPGPGFAGAGPGFGGNGPEFGGNEPEYGGAGPGQGGPGPGYDRAFGGRASRLNKGFGFDPLRNF